MLASVTGPKAIIYFATAAQMPTPDQRTTTINPFAATQGAAARDAPRLHRCQPRLYVVDRRSFRVERRAQPALRVDMEGMLCPALLKYFDSAPPTRYAQFGTASDSAAR